MLVCIDEMCSDVGGGSETTNWCFFPSSCALVPIRESVLIIDKRQEISIGMLTERLCHYHHILGEVRMTL